LSAEAAEELEAAADWYEKRQPGLGLVFLDAVEAALAYLADWPVSGAPVLTTAGARRTPVSRFPYHLPYVLLDDHVRVLAVAHDHRRPGYWRSRDVT
jgi:plasmid stabilization system protein ParE